MGHLLRKKHTNVQDVNALFQQEKLCPVEHGVCLIFLTWTVEGVKLTGLSLSA